MSPIQVLAICLSKISKINSKIESIPAALVFKASIDNVDLLPKNPSIGDMYNITVKSIYGEAIESIRIGNGNSVLFCVYSRFYDGTAADKGLAAWKAHLSTNPLKIVTYTNPEGYVETPLEQSNIDAIKSLYAYNGYTIVNNNENTNMKIMYKTKS